MRFQMFVAGTLLAAASLPAQAATVTKEINVKGTPDKVWAMIGPFCAIQKWHPAIGKCTEDNGVRTLVTKDGKATFVEKQSKSGDMEYTYVIQKSPLPITDYTSTLSVSKKGDDETKIKWTGSYTPDAGKDTAADQAISGIYQGGLDNIQKMTGGTPDRMTSA